MPNPQLPDGEQRCSASVWEGFHSHSCSRKGKNFEDGKWWCTQHTPSVITARGEATEKKWQQERDERNVANKEANRIRAIKDKLYKLYLAGTLPDAIAANLTEVDCE